MPNDKPATEDDSMGSDEQRSAQPAKPGETPVDTEHSTSSPESSAPASSNGEVSPESAERDKPDAESESTAQKESDHDETESKPRTWSDDFGEGMLALERPRDAEANIDTSPPVGEAVSFRSVTVAEIYAGQAIDSLTSALAAIEWTNFDEPLLDQIAEARRGFQYSRWVFWLISDTSPSELGGYGRTSLPSGIDRIYSDCYVLGPSIVAVVLTFVLADDQAKRLDAALRDDAESRLDLLGPTNFSVKTVRDIKREQIRRIQDEVVRRCRSWLKDTMPGTLSATQDGLGPPICALISLATGKPFDTDAEYMALLDLMPPYLVEKFVAHDFLFLIRPISRATDGGLVAAFNEADAVGRGWLAALGAAPEIFHEAITSLMVADGLNAALLSFEPRLRDVRADLNQLDFEKASGPQVIALRNRLLGISRDLSIVCSDVTVLVDDGLIIWADLSPLVRVKLSSDTSAAAETTADTKRRQLREVMESLQAQEAGLRELILVTSASTSETRNLELQTQVLRLTNRLNGLTKWLIVLTVVLVILGVTALVVQVVNTPAVTVHVIPTSSVGSRAASPTPRPSASPMVRYPT
jgi:hypothetical protein